MKGLKVDVDKILSFMYVFKMEKLNPKNIYKIFKTKGLIKSLNLFDEGYYLANYADVKDSNLNPLDHYIYYGWKEKRIPSRKFDGNYYLKRYPDVEGLKINPLIHYVLYGKKEGRFPNHHMEINSPNNKDKLLEEIDKFKSKDYWENRYKQGDNSGVGSYGFFADFKASVINDFEKRHDVETVIEFGHGDGNQLKLASYKEYIGFDVSKTAVEMCRKIFKEDKTKSFYLLKDYDNQKADLTLSLDVIYHLIEDNVFEEYMERLFNASNRYVIIYSSNSDVMKDKANHVKHRKFTDWVEKNLTNWKLINVIKNKYPFNGNIKESSFSDFYFYEKEIG